MCFSHIGLVVVWLIHATVDKGFMEDWTHYQKNSRQSDTHANLDITVDCRFNLEMKNIYHRC